MTSSVGGAGRLACALAVMIAAGGGLARAEQPSAVADERAPSPWPETIIGVLDVQTVGMPAPVTARVVAAVEDGVAQAGFRVAFPDRIRALLGDSSYVAGCHFGPCLAHVYRITRLRQVIVGRVVRDGSSYALVLSLLDTESGLVTSQVTERCPVCTVEEALSSVTLGVVELVATRRAATDPETGPIGTPGLIEDRRALQDLRERQHAHRRAMRRVALLLAGAAIVSGGAGGYLIATDEDRLGYPSLAAGGAFAIAGAATLLLSEGY